MNAHAEQQRPTPLERWRRLYRDHRVIWHVTFTVILVVGVFAVVGGINAVAHAAPKGGNIETNKMCTHNPDGTCKWTPTKMAAKFRAGYFHRAHGVSHMFTKRAHRYVVRHAAHRLENMKHKRFEAIRDHQNAITKRLTTKVASRDGYDDQQRKFCAVGSYMCVSQMSWEQVQARGNCVGVGYYTTHQDTCDWGGVHPAPPSGPITLSQWKAIGAFSFCAAGVIGGLAAEAPTGGAATFIVVNAASACAFSFWAATN